MKDDLCNDLLEVAGGYAIKNIDGVVFLILGQGEVGMTADLHNKLSKVAKRYGYIITSSTNESNGVRVVFKEGEGAPIEFDYGAIARELEDGN